MENIDVAIAITEAAIEAVTKGVTLGDTEIDGVTEAVTEAEPEAVTEGVTLGDTEIDGVTEAVTEGVTEEVTMGGENIANSAPAWLIRVKNTKNNKYIMVG